MAMMLASQFPSQIARLQGKSTYLNNVECARVSVSCVVPSTKFFSSKRHVSSQATPHVLFKRRSPYLFWETWLSLAV